jgi:hypothetical protein
MPRTALLVVLTAALAVSGSAAEAGADQKAKLRVVDTRPLALHGTGFRAGESVRVTLLASVKRLVRHAKAGRNGSFKVSFPTGGEGCTLMLAHAVGSQGSQATARVGRAPCPPPQ